MLLLWETWLRAEHFLLGCPHYQRDLLHGLALIGTYLGFLTYFFFWLYWWVQRTLDHTCAALGLSFTGLLVWAVNAFGPPQTSADAECQLEPGSQPAEEAAVVTFAVFFAFCFHLDFPGLATVEKQLDAWRADYQLQHNDRKPSQGYEDQKRRNLVRWERFLVASHALGWALFLTWGLWSPWYLGIHSTTSLLGGFALGLWGVIAARWTLLLLAHRLSWQPHLPTLLERFFHGEVQPFGFVLLPRFRKL